LLAYFPELRAHLRHAIFNTPDTDIPLPSDRSASLHNPARRVIFIEQNPVTLA
jgi:hypothetical protein